MSQLVLSLGNPKAVPNGLDLFLVPAACAVVSATVLSLRFIVSLGSIKRTFAKLSGRNSSEGWDRIDTSERALGQSSIFDLRSHIQSHGSTLIFAWKLLRLLCCTALSVISTFAVRYASNGGPQHHTGRFLDAKRAEVLLSLFYIYTSLLAALALMLQSPYRAIANYHLVALLLVLLGVYVWHDILPLATYTLSPLDPIGDWLLWSRFGILAFTSVVLPLCIPRQYVPVDPKNPGTPSPEQTAPLISLITYSFLDALVWTTYRSGTGKLDYDLLPPLADRDKAAYLKERSFSKLDPLKRTKDRHLFWGFMSMYWREYCVMGVMAIIQAIADFSGPLGIRYLLKYIENPSQHGYVRPWVWVLLLFLGPITGSFAMQWFIFLSTRILVHIEAIITQLIFEHSLRIRMTGGAAGANAPEGGKATSTVNSESNTTHVQTPEGGTNTPVEGEATNSSDSQTLAASTSSSKDPKQGKLEIAKGKGEDSNLLGKINNLMSTDLKNIAGGRSFMYVLVYSPAQIIGSVIFLYWVLGWSSVVGMALMVSTLPIPGKVAHLVNGVQVERMKKTDARVQSITETMSVIRMIKLFGWEKKIQSQVEEKRETELQWYRKSEILGLISSDVNHFIPTLVMILTFSSHTLLFKKPLTASAVFSSIAVFDILRNQLYFVFGEITAIIQAKVSLDRANDFLKNTELLDTYANQPPSTIEPSPPYPNAIGFRNATFAWAKQSPDISNPSRRNFRLRIDREILFHRGKINMITGPTGCGKTSLLMALLGEMHFIPSGPDSWFSLPRERGVAYAAQEAWVQNETIRNNILLGAEYDEERYNKVISRCALEKDLALFEARDLTEVGVKRQVTVKEQLSEVIVLTGVFQARVSLARAIYSTAEIVILDDVLSALDVHTSRWIVDQCFRGELVAGRTMIIVTHNVAMVGEVADYVVSFGTDGRIISQGEVADVLRSNPRLRAEAEKDKELGRKAADTVEALEPVEEKALGSEAKVPDGKLMMAEEIAVGHVGWPALKLFFISLGGFWFWTMYLGGFALADGTLILQGYWLGVWARAYDTHPGNVDIKFYLAVYVLLCFGAIAAYTGVFFIHIFGSVRAARRIHHHLVVSVLGAPLRWVDSTPMGRVIARFTQDMQSVDGAIPKQLERLVNVTLSLIMCFAAVVIFSPRFTFVGVVILGVGLMIGQIYIASQLSVKREMSNARSPVFSHFGAALAGIVSIRAYGAEEYFRAEALRKIDSYSQSARSFYNLNRWICIRMDALGGLFAASLASYLTYLDTSVDASNTGFALNRAVALSGGIIWWVRFLNEFELQGNSLERIQHYIDIEQEPAPTPEKVPPAYWPSSGRIVVENLTARYHADGPAVLHGLSFEIKSGERVGIVGRTGSGKSSLMLSLLRMIPIEGDIYYDGIPTHAINLDALRSNITIIPQQPELISGTVRQNLDPFDEYDDAFLISALRSAGLDSIQSEGDESRIELDSSVSGGGSNFSLGQRQILALARAIVRKSKVLVLDEATAAIDYNTDNAIQNSIRTELKDRTLIIVAHRLQTICDADKIMVLDAGKILEFDTPAALLRKEGGAFKSLVDESGDRDALYAMAKGQK